MSYMEFAGKEKNFVVTESNAEEYIRRIGEFLTASLRDAGKDGFVLGMSGGLDCSVCAALCARAGAEVLLVMLPDGAGMQKSKARQHALKLINTFSLEYREYDIGGICASVDSALGLENRAALINIRPRVRMTALYALAQENNRLVLGTGNLDERLLGYFTKWGDGACDLAPLAMLTKGEVAVLGRALGIPEDILDKKPSADLYEGQSDEAEFGFMYADLDSYILTGTSGDASIDQKIEKRISANAHKLSPIPLFEG